LIGAAFFTVYLGFINIRAFPTAIHVCEEHTMIWKTRWAYSTHCVCSGRRHRRYDKR
jgi:hypothetical protein